MNKTTMQGEVMLKSSFDPFEIYKVGKDVVTLAVNEDVFLRQNFDDRTNFNEALNVQNAIKEEMSSPVEKVMLSNDGEANALTAEEQRYAKKVETTQSVDQNKMIKYAAIAGIAYLLFFKK